MARRMRRLQFLMISSGDLGARPRCKSLPSAAARSGFLHQRFASGAGKPGPESGSVPAGISFVDGRAECKLRNPREKLEARIASTVTPSPLSGQKTDSPAIVQFPIGREIRLKVSKSSWVCSCSSSSSRTATLANVGSFAVQHLGPFWSGILART